MSFWTLQRISELRKEDWNVTVKSYPKSTIRNRLSHYIHHFLVGFNTVGNWRWSGGTYNNLGTYIIHHQHCSSRISKHHSFNTSWYNSNIQSCSATHRLPVVDNDSHIHDVRNMVLAQLGGMARGEYKDQTSRVGLRWSLSSRRSLNYIYSTNFTVFFLKIFLQDSKLFAKRVFAVV